MNSLPDPCMFPLARPPPDIGIEAITITKKIFIEVFNTLQEYFPSLRPLAEINISNPACWNKDGDGNELDRWIESLNDIMYK